MAIYTIAVLASVAWTLYSGKDARWDLLAYRIFSGFFALHPGRITGELFPASVQSYFNPYALVPFYLLISSNLPSIAIGGILAAVHTINIFLIFEIGRVWSTGWGSSGDPLMVTGGTLLGGSAAIYSTEVGTSSVDILLAIPVLAAVLLLSLGVRDNRLRLIGLAGLLLGLATGMKLTNAVFALAAVAALGAGARPLRAAMIQSLVCGLASIVGFLVIATPWALLMEQQFGNPLFPFFNHYFHSPDFIDLPLHHTRFLPKSAVDWVIRPIAMMSPVRGLHVETSDPDVRWAVLLVVSGTALGVGAWRTVMRRHIPSLRLAPQCLMGLILLAVSYGIWFSLSGNSRYFIAGNLLAGPVIMILFKYIGMSRRASAYTVALVVSVQAIMLYSVDTSLRFSGDPWTAHWVQADVPKYYRDHAYFYLDVNFRSASYLAPYLNPESRMMNVNGEYPLGEGMPGYARAMRLVEKNHDRLRVIADVEALDANGVPSPRELNRIDANLARFGLRINHGHCDHFPVGAITPILFAMQAMSSGFHAVTPRGQGYEIICQVLDDPNVQAHYRAVASRIVPAFNQIEKTCPNLFAPHTAFAIWDGGDDMNRYYNETDLRLWAHDGMVKFVDPIRGGDPIVLGTVQQWTTAPPPLNCSYRYAAPFGLQSLVEP